ncbi:aminoacyl-tRNA synthetase [Fragilaria crotonensis]|nr:aminoacyl-tRNA synthetase [Fragilaria crotonensis]
MSDVSAAAPAAVSTDGTEANTGSAKDVTAKGKDKAKEKDKRVIVVSPCPPSVATAYMILRGTVAGLLGLDLNATLQEQSPSQVEVSILQPTYIKEGIPSAKFSITVGKKLGSGLVTLPEDPNEQASFLNLIETTANRIVNDAMPIQATMMASQSQAQERYGSHILNQGLRARPKKSTDNSNNSAENEQILVAQIQNLITCVPPALPYSTTEGLTIVLDRKQSFVSCGKKAKKAEVVLKFVATTTTTTAGTENHVATLEIEPFAPDSIQDLLLPEGQVLYEAQQQQEQAEAASAAALAAAEAAKQATESAEDTKPETQDAVVDDMVVNAFEVSGKIDYTKLVDKFGSKIIDDDLMRRLKALTVGQGRVPNLHRFLRRNIFFSHRDLTALLDCVEQGRPMYLYTGRGPSSAAMHLGHLVPFLFTQWLQQAFDCPLVIQMTDDEKFLFKGQYDDEQGDNLNYFADLTIENARDIIACGFDYNKTFLFSDLDYVGVMYPNIVRIWKAVTTNTVNGIFGFDGTSNIGKIAFPAIQAAPAFSSSFPVVLGGAPPDTACLIPCAIDQDPYFRMTRDVAHKLVPKTATTAGSPASNTLGGKPALIHSKFFPPLQGAEGKMSSSDSNSAVFLTDTPEEIELKIKQHAFSGGQESKQLQQELGADLDADVAYQWLRFFLEDDDELEAIGQSYASGKGEYWSTGAVKKRLVQVLQELVAAHQERRAKISDDDVRKWMVERNILKSS